ncbi:hypothetical protein [Rhodococcus sp. IEGM 1408]|uniref:hypothetical protein n=1 Tax=Rhodococcus sp. IEGM 1408 TaxID=3082220 RepID=UPI0029538B4C|nr:hypothetical protein [Rhodococcus sp. IEGM 1408]MDV8002381.1 hypothetical protein [Rhodococcus sp. IEGM 1408]
MGTFDPVGRIRGVVGSDAARPNPMQAYRDRHGRRARALASRFEGHGFEGHSEGNNNDDDEVVLRPWELRLPRLVILAAARARGFEPVGGVDALVERGPWAEPMRFARNHGADGADGVDGP